MLSGYDVVSLQSPVSSPASSESPWQSDRIIQVRHVCIPVAKEMENLFA